MSELTPEERKAIDKLLPGETHAGRGDVFPGDGRHSFRRNGEMYHHTRENSSGEWIYEAVRPRD